MTAGEETYTWYKPVQPTHLSTEEMSSTTTDAPGIPVPAPDGTAGAIQLLCTYRAQRTVFDKMRAELKVQSEVVRESEKKIIDIMKSQDRVVAPFDDEHILKLQERKTKPPANVERFTDILFDVETHENKRNESEVHRYIDMLLERVENSRACEARSVPTLRLVKKRRRTPN